MSRKKFTASSGRDSAVKAAKELWRRMIINENRGGGRQRSTEELARPFHTVTRDLEALREWLAAAGMTHVGMESPGVYWRPVIPCWKDVVDLIVDTGRRIRNVPGHKKVKDAE